MPDYSAGTASVRIRPNADDFVRDLNAKLKRVRDPGFVVSVSADTGQAAADIRRFRDVESRSGLHLGVTADLGGARADMATFRRQQSADSVSVKVDVDTGAAMAKIAAMKTAASGGFGGRGGGLLAGLIPAAGAGALGSLPALGSIVANLTQGITQLAGAGLVLPGVIGGIASTAITAKVGFTGMADALEAVNKAADGTPESLKAAEDALGKLAPAAADVIRTVTKLKPEWERAVRDTFQQNMFVGLDDNIEQAFSSAFPTVKAGLGDISSAWNDTFAQLLNVAGSGNTQGILTRLFGNTADSQRIANGAIDPLTSALGTLTATGAEALPRLAYDLQSVATRFDNWISSAASDGRLDEWIGRGITGFENLGNSVINLGGVIGGVASATDGNLLASLERVTAKWDEWVNSTEGQESLKQFISDGDALLSSMANTAKNLGPELKAAFDLSATAVGTLLTSIEGITGALKAVETALPGFSESFKNALAGPIGMANQLKSVLDNNPLASDMAQGKLDAALAAAKANDPRTQPVLAPTSPDGGPAIAAPVPQGPGLRPTRVPSGAGSWENLLVPSRAAGGPVSTTGPAMLHGSPGAPEFVQRASAVSKYGMPFMQALNDGAIKLGTGQGLVPTGGGRFNPDIQIDTSHASVAPPYNPHRITPDYLGDILAGGADVGGAGIPGRGPFGIQGLPKFDGGGLVDEYGNPITQGPLPGGTVSAPSTMSIAPNPTAPGTGGLSGIFSQVLSGMQGPIGNALALGQAGMSMAQSGLPGVPGAGGVDPNTTVHGAGAGLLPGLSMPSIPGLTQAGTAGGDFATRAAGIPGFAGLFGSLASPDPMPALMNWGGQTANWLANWGMETLGSVGSTLWQGALGFFGLENSILSPSNVYNQAAQQTGQFFMDQGGPLGQLLGGGQGAAGAAGGGGKTPESMTEKELLAYIAAQNGTLPEGMKLPKGVGSEKGLQVNTIRTKRAVSAMFPGIAKIGGWREDALKWHPNGLAIDVMIPGWDTAEGKAYGDQVYSFVKANAGALGVDLGATLWQTKDHYDHIHIATTGGGYPDKHTEYSMPGVPAMDKGGPTPNYMGPVDSKGGHLAVVHPKEFMISARGRAAVPDGFLHKLNQGIVDPKELGLNGYAAGGAIRPMAAAMARPIPPPRPPVVPARTMNPQPQQPKVVPTAPAQQATPAPAPSAPTTAAAPPQQSANVQGAAPAQSIIAANQGAGGINHNVDWMNTLIQSSASNLGQLASTAMSIASMGGAGIPGMGAVGAAGPFVAGGIQQGGKIVEGIVNVVSSALVGSVPGSFGGKAGESPYGRVIKTPTEAAPPSGPGGGRNYTFNGISDINRLMDRIELNDKMESQATLAKVYA